MSKEGPRNYISSHIRWWGLEGQLPVESW